MLIGILKFICLAVGITLAFSNVARGLKGQPVGSPELFLMGGGWAGFIMLQWLI